MFNDRMSKKICYAAIMMMFVFASIMITIAPHSIDGDADSQYPVPGISDVSISDDGGDRKNIHLSAKYALTNGVNVDWGDGSTNSNANVDTYGIDGPDIPKYATFSHTYSDYGTYAITIQAYNSYNTTIHIVSYAISQVGYDVDMGNVYKYDVTFKMTKGSGTKVNWTFGDGTTFSGSVTANHTYANKGTFYASGTRTGYGFTDTQIFKVTVMGFPVISFNSNGGSTVEEIQQPGYDMIAGKPIDPTREGYVFMGWYSDQTLQQQFDWTSGVTESMTLYAKWGHTVSFETDGGTVIQDQIVGHGSVVDKPEDPTKTSNTFAGWYSDAAKTNPQDWTYGVFEDITIYAKWEPDRIITLETNGGSSISPIQVPYDTVAIKPTDPIKNGNTFINWYTESQLANVFNWNTSIIENITLFAKWEPDRIITFDTNGGSSIQPIQKAYNSIATKPDNPTKAGNTFINWYTDPLLTNAFNWNTRIVEDITLYAKWEPDRVVTFVSNNGMSIPSETVKYGTQAQMPSGIVKTGCEFAGWYTDQQLTNAYNWNQRVYSDMTLYAKWDVRLTFISNGGSSVSSILIKENGVATKPTDPMRLNYTFIGWYKNVELTVPFAWSDEVAQSQTLYAKWLINYSLILDANGGNGSMADNKSGIVPECSMHKSGYSFVSWNTSNDGQGQSYSPGDAITLTDGDVKLYAIWEKNFPDSSQMAMIIVGAIAAVGVGAFVVIRFH